MPSEITKQKAIKALDGMREIVQHEMLIHGTYVDQNITDYTLAESGAICGGRKHCAIGSLWTGAGVKMVLDERCTVYLPGTDYHSRRNFLQTRHGLRLAYNSLNEAAEKFAMKHDLDLGEGSWEGALEILFEGYYGSMLTKNDMLKIIASAKRSILRG